MDHFHYFLLRTFPISLKASKSDKSKKENVLLSNLYKELFVENK